VAREARKICGPFIQEEGILGVFTRGEAPGAIPNGATVEKINSDDGDATEDGTKGVVVGSISVPDDRPALEELFEVADGATGTMEPAPDEQYVYFVQWETYQTYVFGIREIRIKHLPDEPAPFDPDNPDEVEPVVMQPVAAMIGMPGMTSGFQMLPPPPDACPVCAVDHAPEEPHAPDSLFWQIARGMAGGPPPTWEEALAHCTPAVRESWITALARCNVEVDRHRADELAAEQGNSE
jgi:hypothetical protein